LHIPDRQTTGMLKLLKFNGHSKAGKGKGKGKAEHLYSALHGLRPL